MSQGNVIAYLVLVSWPIISIWLYKTKSTESAILWTIIGGFLFLPVRTQIDFPLVPPLGKDSMPVISAALGLLLVKGKMVSMTGNHGWVKWLFYLFLISPIITVILNGDAVNVGDHIMPSLDYHDAISTTINNLLFILPLFIGKQFFRSYESQMLMFKILVIAGLGYSLLMLYEIRMSPQLHSTLYGYFPHNFAQQKRFGGFRPVVFMGHGLWVAFFAMTIMLAAVTLSKNGIKAWKYSSTKVSYYFFIVLILCKSMGSVVYGLFAFLLIKYTSNRLQMKMALIITLLALAYPSMSILNLVPYNEITNAARMIDDDRADSLQFRFDNETVLLAHGKERFYFGWGGWGRNRVHDSETGEDVTITDGRWIITFGQYGWFGFIAEFGLLAMAVFRANKALKLVKDKNQRNILTAHALLVCLIMLDQIPNATLAPWMWLIAGILLGRAEEIIAENRLQIMLLTESNLKKNIEIERS